MGHFIVGLPGGVLTRPGGGYPYPTFGGQPKCSRMDDYGQVGGDRLSRLLLQSIALRLAAVGKGRMLRMGGVWFVV